MEGFTKLDLMEMTRKHICSHKDRKEKYLMNVGFVSLGL